MALHIRQCDTIVRAGKASVLSLHAGDADRVPIAHQQHTSEINPIRNDDQMRSVVRRTKGDRIETFRLL